MTEGAEFTVLRDANGRLIKGTASLNRKGRKGATRSVSDLLRQRYSEGGEKEGHVVELLEKLEEIAEGFVEGTTPKDQMQAIVFLLRMYQGRSLFEHDGGAGSDEATGVVGRPERQFFSPDAIDRQASVVASALGVPTEKLAETLEAALDYRDALKEAQGGEPHEEETEA